MRLQAGLKEMLICSVAAQPYLTSYFGLPDYNAHRALDDCLGLARLWPSLCVRAKLAGLDQILEQPVPYAQHFRTVDGVC